MINTHNNYTDFYKKRYQNIRHEYITKKQITEILVKSMLIAYGDKEATELSKELGEKYQLPKLRKDAIQFRALYQHKEL
jgi:hypothetical protein